MKFFMKTSTGYYNVDASNEQDALTKASINPQNYVGNRHYIDDGRSVGSYSIGSFSGSELFERFGEK